MGEDTESVERAPRPFAAFLQEQRSGRLHNELSDGLNALAAAVEEHGKTGSLTLKITLHPGKNGADYITVSDEVKVNAPEAPRPESVFFIDKAKNLVRENPRQQSFQLREVGVGGGTDDAKEATAT